MALHSALTGSELHEPKGVASATVGTVYKANGSGSGSWTTIDYNSMPTGGIVQVVHSSLYTTYATLSTVMPVDNSVPQNNEGTEITTVAITPKATTHKLIIEGQFMGGGTNDDAAWAIFQDSTAAALAAGGLLKSAVASTRGGTWHFAHWMAAGTTSSTTFKLRVGPDTGGTWYANGGSSSRLFGGVSACWLRVTEYKA